MHDEDKMVAKLQQAHGQVVFGGTYRHYKDGLSRSKLYIVNGFVIIEATDTVGVIYQAQYGQRLSFVRPVASWLEEVEFEGKKVPRFKQVKDSTSAL